jgi:DNA-binding LytR/AlgR family response regulator
MIKFTCLIVDDEMPARELLKEYVSKIPNLDLVGVCNNAIDAKLLLAQNNVDILFLDVHMPDLTGIELLKILPLARPSIILTTAYDHHAIDGYQLGITDYLLKPIPFERFFQAVNKAISEKTAAHELPMTTETTVVNDHIFLKTGSKIVRVPFQDLFYIEGFREYIKVHTSTQRHIVYQSLSKVLEALPADIFLRVHRSFIINISKIESIDGNLIKIGNEEIPISKSQRDSFMTFINKSGLI